ncbi:MAG: DNA recombination/repair protein RecA, partial [Planctomycetota bacterium]
RDNPDIAAQIEHAIRANAGLVAEEMLVGEAEEEDEAAKA